MLCRRRLIPFTQRLNPRYHAGWVHKDIARRLERFSDDVEAGKSPRLMLLMPPRHGKSELASKMFPAWHLGRYPDHEIIACSYNVSLAMTFSRKVKAALEDPAYKSVFNARLNPNNQSVEEWGLQGSRGGYVAAGVGGGITGKGANCLLIDDPLKNAEEADSAEVREKLWDWYGSTAYTRLAPGGGVLVIQCMTGDTPVMMDDKTERRLDSLAPGDSIATYASGVLASSRVKAIKSNGSDSLLKITTSSGKIVRANQRHPFLTVLPDGGLTWTRAKHLTTAHKIVALKVSGENGRELPALRRGVRNLPNVADYAQATTTSESGQTGIVPQASTPSLGATPISDIATASLPQITTDCSKNNEVSAQYAANTQSVVQTTGKTNSPSITATPPAKSEDCCATIATQVSDTLVMSQWHSPPRGISDFTLDEITSVEPDGTEEVFDLQVEHTENFIANGLVSHNTWWHDDDLAGRLQLAMVDDLEADQFEVVKYPAIAEDDEYLDTSTDMIVNAASIKDELPEDEATAAKVSHTLGAPGQMVGHHRLLRIKGEALHPQRYDITRLMRIKKTIPTRFWSALYQQNPVPDEGAYFTKDQFKRAPTPDYPRCNVFMAWDFAISEKKQNDFTVGTVGLQDEDDLLHIAETVRFKSQDSAFIIDAIINLALRYPSRTLTIGVEDGQIWKAIAIPLARRMREKKVYLNIQVLPPITDKMARARTLQARMQQGGVVFNESADWYETVRNEMLRFPAGVHDDCVDSLAWLAQLAAGRTAPRKAKPQNPPSWRAKLSRLGLGQPSHMSA